MAKMGRPKIPIDKRQFESLCGMMCTEEEIAGFFGCSIDTICNWCKSEYKRTFSDIYKEKSACGKISLRRAQIKLAEKSAAMAIFLGKNYLGQKDVIEETNKDALEKLDAILAEVRENAERETE